MSAQQAADTTTPISLDSTFKALLHWRNNRKLYEGSGIPDDVWKMIFQLETDGYSSNNLRKLFTLNSQQYKKKFNQFYPPENLADVKPKAEVALEPVVSTPEASTLESQSVQFAQAVPSLNQASQKTKLAVTQLKSTDNNHERYLDHSTIIVECIRPDGHRLKIHTTDSRIDLVMKSFYQQEGA